MKIELLSITPDSEKLIELAGRTAYQSQDKINIVSAHSFVTKIIKLGHESVLEHAYATIRAGGLSRALTHQLVRHRLVAYTQKSQRYVGEDGFGYVVPPSIGQGSHVNMVIYRGVMEVVRDAYNKLIALGVPKEDARFVLTNATESEIVISTNFRQWRHMIKLRTSRHAQWEIRKMFTKILDILYIEAPAVFEDLR